MSTSNETRKPAGRPSLLSAEQQNALEKHQPASAPAAPLAVAAPRRKHLWLLAGIGVLAVSAAFAVAQFGEAQPPATTLAAAPAPAAGAVPATPAAPAITPSTSPAAGPAPTAADAPDATLAAAQAPAPAVAAIIDEVPAVAEAKPKESLAQMLESGVPPATKPAVVKAVRKPAKERPVKASDKAIPTAPPEQDNDVELLAALVAHAKYETSANARLSLPKALEQCKKQGKQDAARCRIRVCEGRWKKSECRVYSRSKLEKTASGA